MKYFFTRTNYLLNNIHPSRARRSLPTLAYRGRARIIALTLAAMLFGGLAPVKLLNGSAVYAQTTIGVSYGVTPNIFTAGQPASAVLSVSSTAVPSPLLHAGDSFEFIFSPAVGALSSVVTPVMVSSTTLAAADFTAALASANTRVVVTYTNAAVKTFGYGDVVSVKVNLTANAQTGSGDISFNSKFTRPINGMLPFTTVTIVNFGTGPAGAAGPPGPPGPAGPAGATFNPLQIALLRWYEIADAGLAVTVGPSTPGSSNPTELAFDGASMWVTNASSNSVTKLRASDGAVLANVTVGTGPAGIAFDGASLWVANTSDGTLSRIDASTANVFAATVTVGVGPSELAFDGANIWVTNFGSNSVTKVKTSTAGTTKTTFPVGSGPLGIAFDGANIWVVNVLDGTVTKLRASDGSNQGTFPVGANPHKIAFDGTSMWVTNNGSDTVTKLRASDGIVQANYPVGFASPTGIAFDGANMWVATNGGVVVKMRASDGTVLAKLGVGGALEGVAFDGANVWVVEVTSGTVRKL
jgi:YVTN family beta-propeller protein